MHILMILTSHDELGETGHKTGFWLEEFAAPYYRFLDAGAEVTLASPKGGQPPLDPRSDAPDAQTDATRRFAGDDAAKAALATTVPLSTIDPAAYDALFFPGGHGPMWDLAGDATSAGIIQAFAAADKPVGAVCHGPAAFRHAQGADGEAFIKDRRMTGFTNSEEEAVGLTGVVPFLIENMAARAGATFEKGPDFAPFVVSDGKLVTGQNPASSEPAADALLALLRPAA